MHQCSRRNDHGREGPGHKFADINIPLIQRAPVRFTFFCTDSSRKEGRDFQVAGE